MSMKFFDAVRSSIGAHAVDVSNEVRTKYGHNRLPGGDRLPSGVISPASTEDVATVVRLANEHGITLWPTSTGHNFGMGEFSPVRDGQVVVHLGNRMNRILEVDERLGYALVEPGVTFRELRAELARRGDKLMISATSGPPDGSILGNALDRGAGYTPYFDHFGMLCGLEVVLGDGSVLQTGDGTLPGSKNRFVNKSSFGPLLDGLFSQSNYGIVTQAAIWLMPRPPVIRAFAFAFGEDSDLEQIIELVRPLKMNNVVPTLIKVTSDAYGFATEETYPYDRTAGDGPLPEHLRKELQAKHGTGAWLVSGALYGASEEAVAPVIERMRTLFEGTGNATYFAHEQMLVNPVHKIHIDTFSGEPTNSELGLLNWRKGGGATWFLPATPMIGEVAQLQHETSRRILNEHGLEYMVEFVCGPRAARALHIVIFNREDPDEIERVNAAYEALTRAYDDLGYPIGRTPTDRQESAMKRLPKFRRVTTAIKATLDPNSVIAPGKYGIV
jgi:4-cresol dehydrogenase (hydroxylating)